MAFEHHSALPASQESEEDFCLPGLELQHEMLFSLRDWTGVSAITQRLAAEGAEVHALALNRASDAYVLRCRVKAISARRARAFVNDLAHRLASAASVEHLMLAKAGDHGA